MTFTEEIETLFDSYAEISAGQTSAIKLLNRVHKTLFGSNVKQGCGDCNYKAFTAIQKHIYLQKQKANFNLETMKKYNDKIFIIKDNKVLSMPGQDLTNDNLTDEKAIDLLTKYPNFLKYFERYPGSDAIPPMLDLTLLSSDTIKPKVVTANAAPPKANQLKKDVTEGKVATPPHKRNKLKEMAAMLPGETVTDYADRIEMSERNVLRYVAAGTLPNYDPETKAGKITIAPVVEPEAPATPAPAMAIVPEEAIEFKSLRDRLTPDGLLKLEALYDLDAIEADIVDLTPEEREEDVALVASFLNGEIEDEEKAAEVSDNLANYLKAPIIEPEAPADIKPAEGAEQPAQPAADTKATKK